MFHFVYCHGSVAEVGEQTYCFLLLGGLFDGHIHFWVMYVCVPVVVPRVVYANQPFGESLNSEKMPIPTPVKKVGCSFLDLLFCFLFIANVMLF